MSPLSLSCPLEFVRKRQIRMKTKATTVMKAATVDDCSPDTWKEQTLKKISLLKIEDFPLEEELLGKIKKEWDELFQALEKEARPLGCTDLLFSIRLGNEPKQEFCLNTSDTSLYFKGTL
jgi:hypothetical protein